jgi:allantoinase
MALIKLKRHGRYDYSPIIERPVFDWPGGKRLAVAICNNIEVFSFCDGLGSDSANVSAPQNSRNYAWRDYGNRVGQWYLFDLLDEFSFPASHNFNSLLFDECPQIADRILERGDEFIGHGRTNAERQDLLDETEERELIREASDAIFRYAGTSATGWLGPYLAQTPVTLDLLKEAGYRYVLDWPADDQPFWMRTRNGPILSLPYSIEINDSPVMVFRQQGVIDFERMIIDQFDEMLLHSAKWPLVCTIVLHPFVIGHPFRLRALRRALTHIVAHRAALWITTPGRIADFFYANTDVPGR